MQINDNKLNRNYVETIAGQWVRSNITTASKAMERAEKEHKKNKTKVFNKEQQNVPVWFNKQIEETKTTEDDRLELEELLKEFK